MQIIIIEDGGFTEEERELISVITDIGIGSTVICKDGEAIEIKNMGLLMIIVDKTFDSRPNDINSFFSGILTKLSK